MRYLIIFLFTFQALAIDVVPIKKGESVPEDGFFINKEEMSKLTQQRQNLENQIITLKQLNTLNEDRYQMLENYHQDLSYELKKEKVKSRWSGIGGFFLGTLATSLAVYAATQIIK